MCKYFIIFIVIDIGAFNFKFIDNNLEKSYKHNQSGFGLQVSILKLCVT